MGHLMASKPNQILAINFTLMESSSTGVERQSQPEISVSTVATIMVQEQFYKFGLQSQLNSDQGRSFENQLLQQL